MRPQRESADFSAGRWGAVLPPPAGKTRITIRIDTDVLDWFREQVNLSGESDATNAEKGEAEVQLLRNLREKEAELRSQLEASSDHWGYEDPVYRFYHQSFKVYWLQERTRSLATLLAEIAPPDTPLDPWFLDIVRAGTGQEFVPEDNARWPEATRPIVEAFFHARYFVEMAVRYARLDEPPRLLPSGYAALLCLYGLR